jgi:hypothetical protein
MPFTSIVRGYLATGEARRLAGHYSSARAPYQNCTHIIGSLARPKSGRVRVRPAPAMVIGARQ